MVYKTYLASKNMDVGYVFYLLLLLTVATYGCLNKNKLSNPYLILTLLLIITFISECVSRWVAVCYKSSSPSYHVLIPVNMLLHAIIYTYFFSGNFLLRRIVKITAILAIVCSLSITYFVQELTDWPVYGLAILGLTAVIYSLIGFHHILLVPSYMGLSKQPFFWFNLGNLLFYSITFFVFGFFKPLLKVMEVLPEWQYWMIRFMNLILYCCYFIALKKEVNYHKSML